MLASTGPSDPPMLTSSICSYNLLLKDNDVFWQVSRINFFNERLDNDVLIRFSLCTRLKIILTVLRKGTFVKNEATSSETNMHSSFSWTNGRIQLILSAASKESLSEYLFCVNGFNSSYKYFPTEQCVVSVVSTIGRKDGILSKCLCILCNPCALAILALCGRIFLKVLSSNSPLLLSCFRYRCKVANPVGVGSSAICLNFDLSEKSL